jgi:hypothetical protein
LIGGHDIPFSKPIIDKVNTGCVHIKGLYALNFQQVFANELREMTIKEPHKFKFNRVSDPSNSVEGEQYDERNVHIDRKNCYALQFMAKDTT